MSNSRNEDSGAILVTGGIVAFVAWMVWQFSILFGLDVRSGGEVFLRLVLWAVLAVASWKFGADLDLIEPGNSWPVLLALFWSCWWPALDYWSGQHSLTVFRHLESTTIWWAAWYTKWGVFVAIIGAGYCIRRVIDD